MRPEVGRSSSLFDNRIRFAGYRRDTETGLYHVRHRMYHPTLGRWLQRDPEGYVDGMSLYEYVGGRPGLATDWAGLKSIYLIDSSRAESIHERTGKTHGAMQEEFRDAHNAQIDLQKRAISRKKGPFYLDGKEVSRKDMLAELENRKVEVHTLESGKEATLSGLKDWVVKSEGNRNTDELIYSTHGNSAGIYVGGEFVPADDMPKVLGEALRSGSKDKAEKVTIDSCYNTEENIKRLSQARQGPVAGGGGVVVTQAPVTPYDPRPGYAYLNPDVQIRTDAKFEGKDGKERVVRDAYAKYEFRSRP